MNSTSSGSRSKPLFFNYIKPYMVHFQNKQKILRESLGFTRNSESKKEFFHKHLQVNFYLIWAFFWPWSFEFKITNHVSIDLWIDWLSGMVKIKLEKLRVWGIELNSFFFFSFSFLLSCYFLICFFA